MTDRKGAINRLKSLGQTLRKPVPELAEKAEETEEMGQPPMGTPAIDENYLDNGPSPLTDTESTPSPKRPTKVIGDPLDDPFGMDPEDLAHYHATLRAKQRQEAAHMGAKLPPKTEAEEEADRQAAIIAQRRLAAAQNGVDVLPGQMLQSMAHIPTQAPGMISIWALVEGDKRTVFAPDWKTLKSKIKGINGTWKISHYSFSASSHTVLGFFFPEEYNDLPAIQPKESFDVLVQGGLVFRSDPE